MQSEELILGTEKVTSYFGEWPSFHDSEVMFVQLDRRGSDAPFAEILVFVWLYTGHLTPEGHFEQHRHALIRFRCQRVSASRLEDFNRQNVLDSLHVIPMEGQRSGVRVDLAFIYGLGGFIECETVRVVELIPATPHGKPVFGE